MIMKVIQVFALFMVVGMLSTSVSLTDAAGCVLANTGHHFIRNSSSISNVPGGSGASFILGLAASYGGLAASTVTNVGLTVITGDVGVYSGTEVTGFFPPGTYSGELHAGDSYARLAQIDLASAYDFLLHLPCNEDLTGINLGGLTLAPGVYFFSSSAALSNVALTLQGTASPSDVWVFQIQTSLTTDPHASVILTNGARSSNVFWQVGSSATLDHDTWFAGVVLAYSSISLNDLASLNGSALASTGAVTYINNLVTRPTGNSANCTAFSTQSHNPLCVIVLTIPSSPAQHQPQCSGIAVTTSSTPLPTRST
jgi:hypothetical protein